MFGLSLWELGVAALVAFLLFGPEQFPVMIRQIMDAIKKVKDFGYQAQSTFAELSSEVETTINKSISPLNPDNWASSSSSSSTSFSDSAEPALSKIRLDTDKGNYNDATIDWHDLIKIDVDEKNYHKEPIDWKTLA